MPSPDPEPANPKNLSATGSSLVTEVPAPPHARRNFALFSIEGGLFIGGMAFLSTETVLPTIVEELGGPDTLIAFLPVMMMLGFTLPPLFTAHLVERMKRLKPFCALTGIFQRLAFLLGAAALLLFGKEHPVAAAWVVGLTPLLSGLCGGISGNAFMTLISRVVEPRRRATSFAIRNVIGALLGFGAGWAVDRILLWRADPTGYALLHVGAFTLMMLSWFLFVTIREPSRPPAHTNEPEKSLLENLRLMPGILREDRRFRLFVSLRVAGAFLFTLAPFMVVHARDVTGLPPAFAGMLVQAQMAGGICGNILAGWLGDRFGGLRALWLARLATFPIIALILFNSSILGFLVTFFLFGIVFFSQMIGGITTSIAIAPETRMPTYVSIVGLVGFLGLMAAGTTGSLIRGLTDNILPLALVTLFFTFWSLPLLWGIERENRKRRPCG